MPNVIMNYATALQESKKVKNSKYPKIVFNLRDVNKAPVLTYGVSARTMAFQKYYKEYSMYMVEHAEVLVHNHNIHWGKYPNPRPKHGIK